ncbi:hypothetical protein [Saccharothrix lopnurensis]|uniref:Scaffolding protein n=1 Tax=Saccharothrix lopnurensis TaxID=1670621 RepID=A0ABW1P7A7_9PSEU
MSSTILPLHPTLLDPRTGEPLEAIGVINGRVIWPQMGGAPDDEDDPDDDEDDEGPEPDDGPDEDEDDPDDEGKDAPKGKRALRKKNSENRNLRKRLTAAEEKARRWDEHEASQKTDAEKNADRIAELEKSAADAVRLRVALRTGLTERQAARLVGTTEEELEEDAAAYLAELGGEQDGKTDRTDKVKNRPRTTLKGGSKPDDEPDETDPRKLAARVSRRGRGGF